MNKIKELLEENKIKIITKSEEETKALGRNLVQVLNLKKQPKVIVLTGNLGTGKTKLTQGILSEYGYEEQISSPTFTIVNEYMNYEDETKPHIYHMDVYRLENEEEFYDMGGDEYFDKGLCIIEWGEIIEKALPKEYIHITIKKEEENEDMDVNERIVVLEKVRK